MNLIKIIILIDSMGGYTKFANVVNSATDLIWESEPLDGSLMPTRLRGKSVHSWFNGRKSPVPPAEYVRSIVRAAKLAGIDIHDYELRPDIYINPALQSAA
ncbi:MAG: hypothetical protein ACI93R_003276 [Flavobacteriales bacterium]|jgi:hypothetical protein